MPGILEGPYFFPVDSQDRPLSLETKYGRIGFRIAREIDEVCLLRSFEDLRVLCLRFTDESFEEHPRIREVNFNVKLMPVTVSHEQT